jgi:hypothetical protein
MNKVQEHSDFEETGELTFFTYYVSLWGLLDDAGCR